MNRQIHNLKGVFFINRRYPIIWPFFIAITLILSGCGYHFGERPIPSKYSTFTIPYIKGDAEGILTADLIKQMGLFSGLSYQRCQGDLVICVEIVDFSDENIGFRYDRNKKGCILKSRSIIPTETRTTVWANVKLVESATGKVLLEPVLISSSVDFDHDYYSSRNEINIFSLGQLNDYDAAHDAVYRPLYESLALKIVNYLCVSW